MQQVKLEYLCGMKHESELHVSVSVSPELCTCKNRIAPSPLKLQCWFKDATGLEVKPSPCKATNKTENILAAEQVLNFWELRNENTVPLLTPYFRLHLAKKFLNEQQNRINVSLKHVYT